MFKILTYNIHKGFSSGNQRFILHKIKSALQSTNADLIFLQEIQGKHTHNAKRIHNWPDDSQFEFLADEIWPHHAYGKNAIYSHGHHGNAILSKMPFSKYENIDVSYMKSASRSLLHGEIYYPESQKPLHVICVHLGLLPFERQRQLIKLATRIEEFIPHNEPLIIAGDFNDWMGKAEKHLCRELGLSDAFKSAQGKLARTFPSWMPLLPMDRIYTRGLEIKQCQRLHNSHLDYSLEHPPEQSWAGLSDHIPLLAEFDFK
ncbi:MAG: endonuclease/exonuclease/phosphatase family protein [Gammaproteobacteria bacterium]|nr:endonuclease/exonuclease/phosphatase family protein [Gammaproteobacteria bacterium]